MPFPNLQGRPAKRNYKAEGGKAGILVRTTAHRRDRLQRIAVRFEMPMSDFIVQAVNTYCKERNIQIKDLL